MKYIFFLLNIFFLFNCKLIDKEGEEININADYFYDYVGKDGGVVAFITKYEDNENIFNIDDI